MEDRITRVTTTEKQMTITLKDGTKIPTKAIVTETFWNSGRKDCDIKMDKPLGLSSETTI